MPIRSLDLPAVELLLEDGAIVIANGGGGIPVVDDHDGPMHGVEAVVDKDLSGGLLAAEVDAAVFAILTDVRGVAIGFGTPHERWLGEVTVAELRAHQADGQFTAGSMGPKVDAVCRYVERTGGLGVIASLDRTLDAVRGTVGTRVRP